VRLTAAEGFVPAATPGFLTDLHGVMGILLEGFLGNAWKGRALHSVELLTSRLLNMHNVTNVHKIDFGFDQSIQHIHKDQTLGDHNPWARLPMIWVVQSKALLQRRVNMVLKDPRKINGIFFEIIKGANSIKEADNIPEHSAWPFSR
jgi:hypothetical protein